MPHGVPGRTQLSEADRELLASIRKAEALRRHAYQKRDELIVEAHKRGIKMSITVAAAGFAVDNGRSQVHNVLKRPFKVGMPKPGRKRKQPDGTE